MVYKQNSSPNSIKDIFEGSIYYVLPRMIAKGKKPMNYAEIMKRRIELANLMRPEDCYETRLFQETFTTSDSILYHPDGRVKIVLDSEELLYEQYGTDKPSDFWEAIHLIFSYRDWFKPEYMKGMAKLNDVNEYDRISGREFDISEQETFCGHKQNKKLAKENEILLTLARDDERLLEEYVDLEFDTRKLKSSMKIWFYEPGEVKKLNLRPLRIGSLRKKQDMFILEHSEAVDGLSIKHWAYLAGLGAGFESNPSDWCRFIVKSDSDKNKPDEILNSDSAQPPTLLG